MKLILDTNFVFIPFTHKVSLEAEFERVIPAKFSFCVMQKTIDELNELILRKERIRFAKLAKTFISKRCDILSHKSAITADDAIVTYCKENKDVIIATQDKGLKKRLSEIGVPIIVLRQGSHLELV